MREPSWPWAFLSVLMVLSLMTAVVPARAQGDGGHGGWELDLPHEATPGTTLTISGRTPTSCIAGTAEIGWDPDYNWNMQVDDGRSGHQSGVPVPHGSFTIELALPSTARDGTLYATCERDYGDSPMRSNLRVLQALDTSGQPQPDDRDDEDRPDDDDLFRFEVRAGTVALTGTAGQASEWPIGSDGVFVLAAEPGQLPGTAWVPADDDVQAVRVPRNVGCNVSTCLWGYFAPPAFKCSSQPPTHNPALRPRYGSMTGYGYVRKGKADYVKLRPLYYQDGMLLGTGRWRTQSFFRHIGQPWEAWYALEMHQQFGSPGSTYQVAFQAEWYQHKPLRRDVMIAKTGRVSPVPYVCRAAYG